MTSFGFFVFKTRKFLSDLHKSLVNGKNFSVNINFVNTQDHSFDELDYEDIEDIADMLDDDSAPPLSNNGSHDNLHLTADEREAFATLISEDVVESMDKEELIVNIKAGHNMIAHQADKIGEDNIRLVRLWVDIYQQALKDRYGIDNISS